MKSFIFMTFLISNLSFALEATQGKLKSDDSKVVPAWWTAYSKMKEVSQSGQNPNKTACLVLGSALGGAIASITEIRKDLRRDARRIKQLEKARLAKIDRAFRNIRNGLTAEHRKKIQDMKSSQKGMFRSRHARERSLLKKRSEKIKAKASIHFDRLRELAIEKSDLRQDLTDKERMALRKRDNPRSGYFAKEAQKASEAANKSIESLAKKLKMVPFLGPVILGGLYLYDMKNSGVSAATLKLVLDTPREMHESFLGTLGDGTMGPQILSNTYDFRDFLKKQDSTAYLMIKESPSLKNTLPQMLKNYNKFKKEAQNLGFKACQ